MLFFYGVRGLNGIIRALPVSPVCALFETPEKPQMQKHLTEASVAKIKPDPNRRLEIHDLAITGLRLRVSSSGRRSWSYMYKVAGEATDGGRGKNRRITLGQYPLVNLSAAREKAAVAMDLADRGLDPADALKAEVLARISKRVGALLEEYIELHAKPNTVKWRDTQKLLSESVLPYWKSSEVDALTRRDIHDLLDNLNSTMGVSKTREVRKHLSTFFNWAVDRGYCQFNPMSGMKRKDLAYIPRERVLSLAELKSIWDAAERIGYPFGPVVKLLILTGQRRSEIGNLQREWISDHQIEIPATQYKTGIPHIVPLTDLSRSIIEAQPHWNGGPHLFSTTNGKTPSSGYSKAKTRFDTEVGRNDWTFHDIRRSVATHMAKSGVIQEHIERVLGHVIPGVAGTYNRYSYFEEKLGALRIWELQFLDQAD